MHSEEQQLKKGTSQSAERGEERSGDGKREPGQRTGKEERKELGERLQRGREDRERGERACHQQSAAALRASAALNSLPV